MIIEFWREGGGKETWGIAFKLPVSCSPILLFLRMFLKVLFALFPFLPCHPAPMPHAHLNWSLGSETLNWKGP